MGIEDTTNSREIKWAKITFYLLLISELSVIFYILGHSFESPRTTPIILIVLKSLTWIFSILTISQAIYLIKIKYYNKALIWWMFITSIIILLPITFWVFQHMRTAALS